MRLILGFIYKLLYVYVAYSCLISFGNAQTIPSASDISRVKPLEKKLSIDDSDHKKFVPASGDVVMPPMPPEAKDIRFILKGIDISGATLLSQQDFSKMYQHSLNKEITLDFAYKLAEKITKHYRDLGYFLAVAFLPPQNIVDGMVKLQVIEGYIDDVIVPKNIDKNYIIQAYIRELVNKKPLKTQDLESFLLRLNDLPGYSVNGTLSQLKASKNGAVILSLKFAKKKANGQIGIDNFSSRYLGTHEISGTYSKSFMPLHQTTISGIQSVIFKRLSHVTLKHEMVVIPDFTLEFIGDYTNSVPGLNLERFDLESDSKFFSTSIKYQKIRQRNENLALTFGVDARNTDTDILRTAFIRDRIRAFRMNANYDTRDNWEGFNLVDATFSQGIGGIGASKKNDNNLSRAEADPEFKKMELSLTRLQKITDDWSLLVRGSGQVASGSLYSAEEFGYGGQNFGRAFDASEITGDHGVASSLEFRYNAWSDKQYLELQPYLFYDIGTVWNEDAGQTKRESGSSLGLGMRAVTEFGLNANLGLAMPLIRNIDNPIYGQTSTDPRIGLQIFQQF